MITKRKTLAWNNCDKENPFVSSPLLEAIFFSLIEKVSLGAAEVYNLGAAIPIFLQDGALLAVVCVRYSRTSTNDTAPLVRPIVALVTNTN